VLNRLLDSFTGKLTTKTWAVLAKCSHDTARRDIQSFIDQGLLAKDEGGGRSTSYAGRRVALLTWLRMLAQSMASSRAGST